MRIRFADLQLDADRFVLERGGARIPLRPKVFDLLIYLVRHRNRVVSRDELVRMLWGGTTVGPGSLSGLVNELRNAIDRRDERASSIRTVHARGYQFVAEVQPIGRADEPDSERATRELLSDVPPDVLARIRRRIESLIAEELTEFRDSEGIEPRLGLANAFAEATLPPTTDSLRILVSLLFPPRKELTGQGTPIPSEASSTANRDSSDHDRRMRFSRSRLRESKERAG